MRLHELAAGAKGARKKPKRVGRGSGSGHGKTSCRGSKGQKARAGKGPRPGFEGGQMPLTRRLPKRGFTHVGKKEYQIVNVESLNRFKKDSKVTLESLQELSLIKRVSDPVKILGKGKITKPLHIFLPVISKQAREKIEKAGGKVELVRELRK